MVMEKIETGARVQRSVQQSAQRSVQRSHSSNGRFLRQFDLNTGALGWTMICDDGVHPDRPIGVCPIGLGYRLTAVPR